MSLFEARSDEHQRKRYCFSPVIAMASESGDSNMDREMILADFQVCFKCINHMFDEVLCCFYVELLLTIVTKTAHELTGSQQQS